MRQIEVSVDVFAEIWSARRTHELTEDEILARLLNVARERPGAVRPAFRGAEAQADRVASSQTSVGAGPRSKKWTDVLVWSLEQLGGRATLGEIYRTSREARLVLGHPITREHDASARECLESHCRESSKYRGKADLFYMPSGKGAGVWALRTGRPA